MPSTTNSQARPDGATGATGTRLSRLERHALAYLRRHGVAPSVAHSEVTGGLVILRDEAGHDLVTIGEGVEVTTSRNMIRIGHAIVRPFRIALFCWDCGRRFLRPSNEYDASEVCACPGCGVGIVIPADPLAASRDPD